jgi:hypothetical protein
MAFPQTPLDTVVELLIDGVWTDITSEPVYARDQIQISNRGLPDGANETPPSRCILTLNNRNGKFSPRNPVSPYYKKIGRNTPVRVRIPSISGDSYIRTWKNRAGYTTPDSAAISLSTVLDLRIEVQPDSWTDRAFGLAAKYLTTGDQRSWAWWVDENRNLKFFSNGTGALAGNVAWISDAVVPFTTGRGALRTTFESNDGSGNRRVTHYTAASLAGPWTQLGNVYVLAGTTTLFDSTAELEIARVDNITAPGPVPPGGSIDLTLTGRVYGFEMYSDLGTTLAASFDPELGEGPADITDAQGNVWTSELGAYVVNPGVRFTGEVSAWPQEWDTSGEDRYVRIDANGVLRRLQQGSPALSSPMYRGITAVASNVVAYWPMEDEAGALQLASGIGGPPMVCSVPPEAGSYSGFVASKPVAQTPSSNPGTWRGGVPLYSSPSGSHMVRWMMHVPTGTLNNTTLIRVLVASSQVGYIELAYLSAGGGDIKVRIFNPAGTEIVNTDANFDINDKNCLMSIDLEDTGTDLHWNVLRMDLDLPIGSGGNFWDGTLASTNIARVRAVEILPNATAEPLQSIAFGHVSVQHGITSFFELDDQAKGWIGETAGGRFARLCTENDLPSIVMGDADASQRMGVQPVATLAALLQQCATADVGLLYEPRDSLGLVLRTRLNLTNQNPALELDYSAFQLTRFTPIDDDQLTRNDITVSREGGSSARVIETSPANRLNTSSPPVGVGTYDDSITVNVETDAELIDHAGWRVHLGTIEESRFPDLALTLSRTQLVAKRSTIAALDIGDRVTVANPPADRMPPDTVSQLAFGLTETLDAYTWDVVINAVPEAGWTAAAWASDSAAAGDDPAPARYAPDASDLAVMANSTQTTLYVNTSLGPLWSTATADYPQDIWVDGEVAELTAVGATPSFVAAGTGASGTGNGGITASLPAGAQSGDVVAIFCSIRNSGTGVPVRPNGWYEALNFSASNCRLFLRRYDGAWSMPAVTFTGGAGTDDTLAQSAAFRGVDWPVVSALSQLNASAQSILTPSLPIPEWVGVTLGLGWKQDDWTSAGTLGRAWVEINERTSVVGSDAGQVWDYSLAPPCATQAEASSFFISGGAAAISRSGLVCLPVNTPAVNSNPYFETDALGWTATSGVTLARSTSQAHSGTASGLCTTVGSPANWSITSQSIIPSIQGQLWSATCWVYSPAGLNNMRIVLAWADETGTALSVTAGATTNIAAAIWTPLTISGFSPASTGFAQIRLQALTNPPAGSTIHADELELKSPRIQVFTVGRSVNGVIKSHAEGTDVRVNPESFWSL